MCRQVSTHPDAVGDRAGQGRTAVQPSRAGCKPRYICTVHGLYGTDWSFLDKGDSVPCACALGWLFLFFLGGHHPSSCRLRPCTSNGADYCRPRDMAAQDRPRCDIHAGGTYSTYSPTYTIHALAEGDGGVRGGGGERRHVDRADFDGASRGEVRIEWLTLCPPADPMDRKPMDAV